MVYYHMPIIPDNLEMSHYILHKLWEIHRILSNIPAGVDPLVQTGVNCELLVCYDVIFQMYIYV